MNELVVRRDSPVTFLLPVCIVYAQSLQERKESLAFELRVLKDTAQAEGLDPFFVPTENAVLHTIEEELRLSYPIERVFHATTSFEISFFPTFWFAGEGTNAFARAILKYLQRQDTAPEIVDYTSKKSLLGRQLKWFLGYREVQEYIKTKQSISREAGI